MDIDTLRKIQETEKMLRIHSINFSTQEAIQNSKNDIMVGGNRVPTFEDVEQSPGQQVLHQKEAAYEASVTQQKQEVPKMDNQVISQLRQTVDEQSTMMARQAQMIHQLQGVVNEIIKEINKLQTTIPTKNPSERQVVLKPEEVKEHPRSGGYTPSDVSVDKFFNFSGTR